MTPVDTVVAAIEASDSGDPKRPRIGEVGLSDAVLKILLRGRDVPLAEQRLVSVEDRARMAVDLIVQRVRRAYRLEEGA